MTIASTDANSKPAGRLAALGYRDFRLFWTGQLVSNIGTWMQMTATSWLLYQLTGSAVLLGLNGIFRAVPAIGLGVISGTFADRYDRRSMLLWTQLFLGLLAFGIGVLVHLGQIQAWHIYTFTFLSASVGAFDGPARQAMFPSLVPRPALPNAVALNSLLWKGSALVGPSLGGIAISLMGTAGAFYANAASFAVVVVTLLRLRVKAKLDTEKRRHFTAETQEGFAYIAARPIMLGITLLEAVASVFGLDHTMLTVFASDILRVGAHGFGLLQSARGLGAVIGSGFYLAVGQRPHQGRILFVSAICYGVGFALFGLSQSFPLSLLLMTFVGVTDTIWGASRGTIMQIITPEQFRGRVMGVFQLSNRGLHPLGQVESGLVIPLIGAPATTVLGGLIVAAVTVLTALKVPAIPRFRWDHESTGGAR
ncbi:MAG TPA: MFS transporter, partial [Candidatus Limnocylindrales bacterium]|nr:MFS transporter [Candidatus Limnocylindrales bacterium]